jgi:homogentisate 1,2-dioxygenase
MTPHGPDTATFEAASTADTDTPTHLCRDSLAFMFEAHLTPRVTPAALGLPCIDRDYYKCWMGLRSHFSSVLRAVPAANTAAEEAATAQDVKQLAAGGL